MSREFFAALLKSFGTKATWQPDLVTLEAADLERILTGLLREHERLHQAAQALLDGVPPARIYQGIIDACEAFHATFPLDDAVASALDAAATADAERVLALLMKKTDGPVN